MSSEDLAEANRSSAQYLIGSNGTSHHQGVCNWAYYSTYSLVTSKLPPGIIFAQRRNNPDHANLPKYVDQIQGPQLLMRSSVKRSSLLGLLL